MQAADTAGHGHGTDEPGGERRQWSCPVCGGVADGDDPPCGECCEDCAALTVTLDIETLGGGTQTSDPGNDPWPLRNQLMLTTDGEITWRSDVPGGGFPCTDAITLGSLPCNLTGKSLIWIAERLRDETGAELQRLLAGRQAPVGLESYGDAVARVAECLTDAVDSLAEYRVHPDQWFTERIPVSELLEHSSPAAWAHYQRSRADVELVDVSGWLEREIRARLDEAAHIRALIAAGIDPEDDGDTPEETEALRAWAAR